MSYEQVKQYFSQNQLSDRVLHFEQSSATVEQAAAAVGCAPCQIAKTLSFRVQGEPVLIVAAGDARIDNPKFKALFHEKARMIPAAEVEKAVGHAPGGVCPFALLPGVKVYLDISLRRFFGSLSRRRGRPQRRPPDPGRAGRTLPQPCLGGLLQGLDAGLIPKKGALLFPRLCLLLQKRRDKAPFAEPALDKRKLVLV